MCNELLRVTSDYLSYQRFAIEIGRFIPHKETVSNAEIQGVSDSHSVWSPRECLYSLNLPNEQAILTLIIQRL